MPKTTPLREDLSKRAARREEARKMKRLRPGQGHKVADLIENIIARLEAIEEILGLKESEE
ncbi:MAG: hypothetical protein DRJ03_05175 [Chloroflexi bacterium]|nr:MAG: hypothetical protein DRJ03_05175 [Chloroflexota bacterium]